MIQFWHTFSILCHPLRAGLFPTCSLLFRKDCFGSILFYSGTLLDQFCYPFGPLAPMWLLFGSRWLHLPSFFDPFAARHGISMHFHIMYSHFSFTTFILIARWRDRSFAAHLSIYVYINIHIYSYIHLYIYLFLLVCMSYFIHRFFVCVG